MIEFLIIFMTGWVLFVVSVLLLLGLELEFPRERKNLKISLLKRKSGVIKAPLLKEKMRKKNVK